MTQVEISVVIPTRNRLSKVEATLRSLYQQNVGGLSCEIVVVDDGSAPAVVLPQRPALPTRLVRVEGVGRSLARNTGAKSAKGKLLVFLDDDMQVGADFLAAHHRAHRQWPEALLVGAIRLPLHEQAVPFVRFRQRLEDHGIPPRRGLVSVRNFCTAANMAIVRDRFLNLGGFDPSIHSSEDQDFALRHTAADGEIAFIPEAQAIHDDDALTIRDYCRRSEWGMREMMPFCLRYPDWPDNIERARINGPLHLGKEPFSLSLRKVCKLALSLWPMPALLFACVSLVESRLPQAGMLDRLYRLLLGIFVFRGYRNGLNEYGREAESGRNPDAQFSASRLSP